MSDPIIRLEPEQPQTPGTELDRSELVARASLVLVNGSSAGRVFPLYNRETVIGRSERCTVHVDVKAVLTEHAKLVAEHGKHYLIDLGSTNGTFLNGRRLLSHQPTVLTIGDSIQVAEAILAYVASDTKGHAEQTQQLSSLLPQLPGSKSLQLPELQLLSQLLRGESGTPAEPPGPSLEDYVEKLFAFLRIVRRNWVPLFCATMLCALVGNATVFLMPPASEATMKLRMSLPRAADGRGPSMEEVASYYSAAEQDFFSPGLAAASLKASGVPDPSQFDVAVALGALKLENITLATYAATYTHRNPEHAVKFLRHQFDGFIESQIAKTIHVAQAEVDFLAARLHEREEELHRTEQALSEFKSKHLEGLPEYATQHVTSRETLLGRRAELAADLEKSELELTLARKRLTEQSPLLTKKVEAAAPYEQALVEVNRKLGEARGRGLGDEHPEVAALLAQQKELQRLAQEAKTKDPGKLEQDASLIQLKHRVGDLEVQAKGNRAALGEVGGQLSRLNGIVGQMPGVEAKYSDLTRSYTATKEQYTELFQHLRTSQLELELERTAARARFELLSPPASPGTPLRRALFTRTAIGGAVGLVLGAAIAALLELRRYLRARRAARSSTAIVPVDPSAPA